MNKTPSLPPMPIREVSIEQEFTLRVMKDMLPEVEVENLMATFLMVMENNYVLQRNIDQLVKEWPVSGN